MRDAQEHQRLDILGEHVFERTRLVRKRLLRDAYQPGTDFLEGRRRKKPRPILVEIIESFDRLVNALLANRIVRHAEHRKRTAGGSTRRHLPAHGAQDVDADARAIHRRVTIDELVTIELVIDSAKRVLNKDGASLVLQHRDNQVGRTVPSLAAVEVGQVVIQRQHRRDDALFTV